MTKQHYIIQPRIARTDIFVSVNVLHSISTTSSTTFMPITYRQRPTSTPADLDNTHSQDLPSPTDADDSIVLSDLVRRGEASRLRRRGAMRLDHSSTSQPAAQRNSSPPVIYVGSPTWEMSAEGSSLAPGPSRSIRSSRQSRRNLEDEPDEDVYTLVCGGYADDVSMCAMEDDPYLPFHTPPLPVLPPTSSNTTMRKRASHTNGCGALIHVHAVPRPKLNVWTAKSEASSSVITLDPSYFDQIAVGKMVKNACGCVREGIGCAICGNPLGTRYRPCKTAGDGISTLRAKPPGPLFPEGPRYWHASTGPSTPFSSNPDFIYTFFASSVTPFPHYEFPCKPNPEPSIADEPDTAVLPPPSAPADMESVRQDVYLNAYTDRYITASPVNLSDVGEDDRDPNESTGAREPEGFVPISGYGNQPFDPDGEFISLDEPGSPDKTAEVMLSAER